MSKQEKKGLVPILRFPEFRTKGEWGISTLGQLAKRITKKNKGSRVTQVLTNSAIDGVVDQRDYFDKNIANKGNLDGHFIVDEGDYVYNPRISAAAPVGPISKNKLRKGVMSPLYTVFRFNNANNDFFEQYFKSTHWYHYLRTVSNSGARHDRMSISTYDFEKMPLPDPKPEEQQKIADCLTSNDELVTAEAQKLDALKAHKKGLMQQLFPTEGDTQPKLRFPEFRGEGEWKTKPFGKLIKINSGKGFKASEYSTDGIRLLQIENVGYGNVKWTGNTIYLPESYTLEYPGLVLREGDIVLALNRPVTNNELKIARLRELDEPSVLYQRVGKLELLSEMIVDDFVFHMSQWFIRDFVVKQSIGSDQPFISVKTLYAQEITIPSPPEQQKIADCLASIDDLITAQTQKIDALKAHKIGLLQKLFPAMDEVDA